jgi:hypothetical protein
VVFIATITGVTIVKVWNIKSKNVS